MLPRDLRTPPNGLIPPAAKFLKANRLTYTSFRKLRQARPFRPLPRTQHALQVSPFLKIPLELRNEIYALVVVSEDKLHLTRDDACQYDQFYFQLCPAASMSEHGSCYCMSHLNSPAARFLDTSLLMVSEQIRTEAMRILFARNTFHFESEQKLDFVAMVFSKFIGNIRYVSLQMALHPCLILSAMFKEKRRTWKTLSSIRQLTVYALVEPSQKKHNEEELLNHFRLLAFLPLDEAEVHFRLWVCNRRDGMTESILANRARAMLLRDPSLPEEAQIRSELAALEEEEKKHTRWDFVPGLVSGKM